MHVEKFVNGIEDFISAQIDRNVIKKLLADFTFTPNPKTQNITLTLLDFARVLYIVENELF